MFTARRRFLLSLSLIVVLLVPFFGWGCAHRSPFDLGLGAIRGPEDIIDRINGNAQRLHALRAEARIHWPQISKSRLAKVSVLFAQPSRYRIKFGTLFGMTMAVMTVRDEEISIYVPQANRLYQGQPTDEELADILDLDISLTDLMETLVGTVRLPSASHLLEYQPVKEGYALSFQVPGGRQDILVGGDGLRILMVELFDSGGQSLLVKTYRDHRVLDGIVRPGQVELSRPDRGEELRLTFTQQWVNHLVEEADFELDLPASVELVPLQLE